MSPLVLLLLGVAPFVAVAIAAANIINVVKGGLYKVSHDLTTLHERIDDLARAVEALEAASDFDDEPSE